MADPTPITFDTVDAAGIDRENAARFTAPTSGWYAFEWPGKPPPMVDGEMAWYDDQWHVRHADGTITDFPDLLQERYRLVVEQRLAEPQPTERDGDGG